MKKTVMTKVNNGSEKLVVYLGSIVEWETDKGRRRRGIVMGGEDETLDILVINEKAPSLSNVRGKLRLSAVMSTIGDEEWVPVIISDEDELFGLTDVIRCLLFMIVLWMCFGHTVPPWKLAVAALLHGAATPLFLRISRWLEVARS